MNCFCRQQEAYLLRLKIPGNFDDQYFDVSTFLIIIFLRIQIMNEVESPASLVCCRWYHLCYIFHFITRFCQILQSVRTVTLDEFSLFKNKVEVRDSLPKLEWTTSPPHLVVKDTTLPEELMVRGVRY